jgi:hypothetical protein
MGIIGLLVTLPLLLVFYQLYSYAVSLEPLERQRTCQGLGISYMVIGIMALVFRTLPCVIFGVVVIMFGLRLVSYGLDRLNKITFIDHYEEDDK